MLSAEICEWREPMKDLLVALPAWQDPEADAPGRIVFAGGCFWCVEAIYRQIKGVMRVVSGYAGGNPEHADYRTVCTGKTGHAEAVDIRFDPETIGFGHLLQVFFGVAHDPTQKNRQGNDVGRQYRSAIFVVNDAQADVARAYMGQIEREGVFPHVLVTEISMLEKFYPAEGYHQDYARLHPDQPYICQVSTPKLERLRQMMPLWLRTEPLQGSPASGEGSQP